MVLTGVAVNTMLQAAINFVGIVELPLLLALLGKNSNYIFSICLNEERKNEPCLFSTGMGCT